VNGFQITVGDSTGRESEAWKALIDHGELSVELVPKPGEYVSLLTVGKTIVALAEMLDAICEEEGVKAGWILGAIGFDDNGTVRVKATPVKP
jgi:hypothetical protein